MKIIYLNANIFLRIYVCKEMETLSRAYIYIYIYIYIHTHTHKHTIKIVYCQYDMFRPLLGQLQALWENRSKSYLYFSAMWDPKYLQIVLHECEIQGHQKRWTGFETAIT